MAKHPKRPRDPNQWAKRVLDIATGQAQDDDPSAGKDQRTNFAEQAETAWNRMIKQNGEEDME